jgi:hypothetical protein
VIDLAETTQSEARRKTETQLMQMRQPDYPGLIALYAIDRTSHPDEQNKDTRVDLDAADDVVGLGMVFPGTGAEEPVTYMSADLSRLGMSADEIEQPEEEDPEAEVAASG